MLTYVKNRVNPYAVLERAHESTLPTGQFGVVRVDGKAFHTFTKQFEAPFSEVFAGAMDAAAITLCKAFSGVLFAYAQSDEISLVFTDTTSPNAQYPVGGRTAKLASLAASTTTAGFMAHLPELRGLPVFDGRAFSLATADDVRAYVEYRRKDARKNAISMAAEEHYSHRQLLGKSTHERTQLLAEVGVERLPERFFHGRFIVPSQRREQIEYVDKRDGSLHTTVALRNHWVTMVADQAAVASLPL